MKAKLEYVYLIMHKNSGRVYVGSRSAKNCNPDEFWTTYFTSSKVIKKIINDEGRDSFEVLEIIPRPLCDAVEYENAILRSADRILFDPWHFKRNALWALAGCH